MKRFCKPLVLIGFSVACVAFIASGAFFTQASDKRRNAKSGLPRALAAPLLTEDFSYTAGSAMTANGWTAHSAGGTNAILVTSPGLSYSGYAGSGVGNAVTTTTSGEDISNAFSAVTSGTVYAALMVNVTSSQTAGDYFFHLMNFGTTTFRGRVFVRKDASTTNFAFGIARTSGTPEYTANTFVPGTTYLLVVKYTYVAGASNDVVELFVDPTPGGIEPVPTLTATDADASEPAQLSGVGIRQGSASNAATVQVDGIRVATTWADAVAGAGGPTPTPTPQKPQVDMNGDGLTDFVITRPGGSSALTEAMLAERRNTRGRRSRTIKQSQASSLTAGDQTRWQWWSQNNNAPGGFAVEWGLLQVDTTISADFDGDGADDIAVWRPDAQATFYSLDSSDFTFRAVDFGLPGDDPIVVADYDGDGIDDPAVYRCPFGPTEGTCYFFYKGSLNNPSGAITFEPWGFGTFFDWAPYPGDFNGDGKFDFCVQDLRNQDQAVFWLRHNQVEGFEVIEWGLASDRPVPGDFDGDGKSDFTVVRIQDNDQLTFYTLLRAGGHRFIDWGISPDDITPGDYDGDGKTDIAIFRWWEPQPAFWILPSNGDPHWAFIWGAENDYPLAKWQVP